MSFFVYVIASEFVKWEVLSAISIKKYKGEFIASKEISIGQHSSRLMLALVYCRN